MKKFISVMLTLLMVFSCVSLVAFAEDEEPVDQQAEIGVEAICIDAGDIDYSGRVNATDARLALRYAVQLEDDASLLKFGPNAIKRGDVDPSEGITAADARQILRYAVELDPLPGHKTEAKEAKWTASGNTGVCVYCGEALGEKIDSKIDAIIADANAWAADKGVANLIKGVSENEGSDVTLELNVDAIWEGIDAKDGAFDGFLTNIGAYVNENIADAVITFEGEEVYNGKVLNTPIKHVIFNVFAGVFYKIAHAQDGVYGTYALTIDGEDVNLTVKMTGSEANLKKVQDFADVIEKHISADTSGNDLKICVEMPDALMNTVNSKGGLDRVNASTFGECLNALKMVDLNSVIGSQQSAVNKMCATICGLDSFVNKVAGKVTAATVTVGEEKIDILSGKDFAPKSEDYQGFLAAVIDMLSDDVKNVKMGDVFDGESYLLKLDITVDVGNAAVMERGSISETIYIQVNP